MCTHNKKSRQDNFSCKCIHMHLQCVFVEQSRGVYATSMSEKTHYHLLKCAGHWEQGQGQDYCQDTQAVSYIRILCISLSCIRLFRYRHLHIYCRCIAFVICIPWLIFCYLIWCKLSMIKGNSWYNKLWPFNLLSFRFILFGVSSIKILIFGSRSMNPSILFS